MLWSLPYMVWLGILGGLLLLAAAALQGITLLPPKPRLKWHRRLALVGLLLVAIHAVLGLSRFI